MQVTMISRITLGLCENMRASELSSPISLGQVSYQGWDLAQGLDTGGPVRYVRRMQDLGPNIMDISSSSEASHGAIGSSQLDGLSRESWAV